jgi:hypothetical protein
MCAPAGALNLRALKYVRGFLALSNVAYFGRELQRALSLGSRANKELLGKFTHVRALSFPHFSSDDAAAQYCTCQSYLAIDPPPTCLHMDVSKAPPR